jgi:4-amino-4-deoxy-L-arabinose transferase-like glycosyltransferase
MPFRRHPLAVVLVAATLCLLVGFSATPFWDEDEPRFAAIARTMAETGDWIVPVYNGQLAVDKPVLMHWCMAACMRLFGSTEFAARLPAAIATLLTALALLRAGTRWFDAAVGVVAALAYVGCLLVGVESHAATPDAILVALTTWATILAVEPLLTDTGRAGHRTGGLPRLGLGRATAIGGLLGLGVLCKGPIGFVGPLAVILPWVGLVALQRRLADADAARPTAFRLVGAGVMSAIETLRCQRIGIVALAALATAAPWYLAVAIRTNGAWPAGFFMIHNVGRFVAPMEKHGGGVLYHPLTMLVGFYPWSCFLPLAVVVAAWRVWKRVGSPALTNTLLLLLVWMAVWISGFSAAATKLPNYILPAYPAAALLVAALGVEASRRVDWPHPRWLASGLGWVAFGGLATAITVIVGTRFGLTGAEPAAAVGLVPIIGAAASLWWARRSHPAGLAALVVTGLVYTALFVGPAGRQIARANALPALIDAAHAHAGGQARLAAVGFVTPNVVYYSRGVVPDWQPDQREGVVEFLQSGPDAVVMLRADALAELQDTLPPQFGVVGRARPLFRQHDFVIVGSIADARPRTAGTEKTHR